MIIGPRWGTDAWRDFRRGMVTASEFATALTPPKTKAAQAAGEMSDTAAKYLWKLVHATITGKDQPGYQSKSMERGTKDEADAIDAYCRERCLWPEDWSEGRIIRIDGTIIGGTPDLCIETDHEGPGTGQVKCPDPHNYLRLWWQYQEQLRKGIAPTIPPEYVEQVQGEMWVAERQWCDFIQFDKTLPRSVGLFIVRVYRDDEYINNTLAPGIHAFADLVQQRVDDVRQFLSGSSPAEAAAVVSAMSREEDPNNLFAGL